LYEEVTIAGFGGQGIILAGKLLAQTAMMAGREVTYMPAYGAEMRGGTANSAVIIADEPIASPLVSRPNTLIAMNQASVDKFAPRIKNGGLLVMNSSLIAGEPQVGGSVRILKVPCDDLAIEMGNAKVANMVAIGAYLEAKGLFSAEAAGKALPEVLTARYHKTLPLNERALERGARYAAEGR
jgi:2-oxoglutarate ferredoxin oxidoreductase subunit gamma